MAMTLILLLDDLSQPAGKADVIIGLEQPGIVAEGIKQTHSVINALAERLVARHADNESWSDFFDGSGGEDEEAFTSRSAEEIDGARKEFDDKCRESAEMKPGPGWRGARRFPELAKTNCP
jgi:hypothetical protein